MKFGGTSVADLERIRRVGRLVAAEVAAGHRVAVVVSAMAGKTNEMVAWTDAAGRAASGLPESDDEYDTVVASGEQVTAGLLAMVLRNMGLNARSWLGWQVPIMTDDAHGRARIEDIPPEKLVAAMDAGEIAVIAGFQGVTSTGRITTLGRGGSDTSAVAIAAAKTGMIKVSDTDFPMGLVGDSFEPIAMPLAFVCFVAGTFGLYNWIRGLAQKS